ncbi:3-oxoacyl-[acyl-carrier-protein] reductase-like isoform X2 [Corticium candelabrum]|uniref:3-oxoacyl-[acyl-carrier-protein] reductase-like isoform X2 n=1 Tax=Corticium candelabrum TaxID=121492 RepID=UPI002E2723C8|nr:3-oxoacyl-[acyl-carrier-protein] reductase-like isoform X2 [Corticium candelabrum]
MSGSSASVCVVFGGSRGIGRTVCQHMARIGYSVVCASRQRETCEEVVKNLTKQTEGEMGHLSVECDVSEEESVVAACQFIIERAKRADVLVNAAGVNKDSLLMRLKIGNVGQSAYSASKAGLIGFTRSLAKEVGSRGVRANVLAPGFIETDMTAGISADSQQLLIDSIPIRRFGTVEETAHAVEFLAAASYVTGQVLVVDGGMSMAGGI